MPLTVSIVAAGAMGSGVAQRLTENGVTVLTSLAGRSEASARRANAAGMRAVDDAQLMEADLFLSIVPPGDARRLAERFQPLLKAANRKPVFVDCNAVSPPTMRAVDDAQLMEADLFLSIVPPGDARRLAERFQPLLKAANRKPVFVDCNAVSPPTMRGNAEVIAASGAPFVAAGIIGPPPKPGSGNTKLYVSGPAAQEVMRLNDHGMIVRIVEGPLTAASALKMSYAGITKGFTALAAGMMLAATREGSAEALKAELAESQPAMTQWLGRQIPAMYSKAYRWVAELDEIGSFVGEEFPEHAMLTAAARFYQRIAEDYDGEKDEVNLLEAFVKPRGE